MRTLTMPTNNGRVKSWRKKKQSNIDCIPVFGFLLKKCVKMLLRHCFITIFTVFMKLFFERNAKYQATRTISTNYQDISIFFSFNSNSILLTEQWKWEEKKHNFFSITLLRFPTKKRYFFASHRCCQIVTFV